MATTNLTLVTSEGKPVARRNGQPRPYTTYYFEKGKLRPIRIARSSSPTAAVAAVVRRILNGEKIAVAEVCSAHGKLLKTVSVRYRKIAISG